MEGWATVRRVKTLYRAGMTVELGVKSTPVQFIHRRSVAVSMAKSDSFFIRKTVDIGNDNNYYEDSIDLGAYVDALGKSVLRVHNVQVVYSDNTGRSSSMDPASNGVAQWQLCTQTQSNIVLASDKSLISSGRIQAQYMLGAAGIGGSMQDVNDVNVQHWTNGYLVGVEQIYLGGSASTAFVGDVYVSIVMECTVETLSSSAAMALALSQQ